MKATAFAAVAALIAAILPEPASATVLRNVDLYELVERSEFIFFGEVKTRAYERDADGTPWTQYTFSVREKILGGVVGDDFMLRCVGGSRGDTEVTFIGTPTLLQGEAALVFFDEDDTFCQFTAWDQGTFREVSTPEGRRALITEDGEVLTGIGERDFTKTPRPSWIAERVRLGALTRVSAGLNEVRTSGTPARLSDIAAGLRDVARQKGKAFTGVVAASRAAVGPRLPSEAAAPTTAQGTR